MKVLASPADYLLTIARGTTSVIAQRQIPLFRGPFAEADRPCDHLRWKAVWPKMLSLSEFQNAETDLVWIKGRLGENIAEAFSTSKWPRGTWPVWKATAK